MSQLTVEHRAPLDPEAPLAVTVTITNTSVGTGGTSTSTSTGAGTSTSTSTSTGASRGASTSTGATPDAASNTGADPGGTPETRADTAAGAVPTQPNVRPGTSSSTITGNETRTGTTENGTGTGNTGNGTRAGTTGNRTETGTVPAQHKDVYPTISPMALADSMHGRVILVSGAGRGIGRSIALSFAHAGAAGLALLSRTSSELISLASEISRKYPKTKALVCAIDITDRMRVAAALSEIKRKLGTVDVLVVNAGVRLFRPFVNTPEEEWWRVMEVNVRCPLMLARMVLPGMQARRAGTIIFISSYAGVESIAGSSAFSVSKTALIRAAACLQLEFDAESGRTSDVCMYSVNPGDVKSDITLSALHPDIEKMENGFSDRIRTTHKKFDQTPELCAQTCVYLATGRAAELRGRYINVRDDIEDLVRQANIIREEDLYDLGVRTLGG